MKRVLEFIIAWYMFFAMMTPPLWMVIIAESDKEIRSATMIDMYDVQMVLALILTLLSVGTLIYISVNLKSN